ncbi:MAG: hypothetical protein LBD77_11735 [Bifidobacteriaceae bacterium]|nr:hypothetical protein [Bifidobacteriaceae bacterium]
MPEFVFAMRDACLMASAEAYARNPSGKGDVFASVENYHDYAGEAADDAAHYAQFAGPDWVEPLGLSWGRPGLRLGLHLSSRLRTGRLAGGGGEELL